MVYLKKNCNFPRFQRGWGLSIFPGGEGSNLLQGGGGQLLIPFTHITCVYSRGTGPLAPSPLDPRMQYLDQLDAVTEFRY